MQNNKTKEKKSVSFDESSIADNKKFFEENPVILKITEPKTPFEREDPNLFEKYLDKEETWEEKFTGVAKQIKEDLQTENINSGEIFHRMKKAIYIDEGKQFISVQKDFSHE